MLQTAHDFNKCVEIINQLKPNRSARQTVKDLIESARKVEAAHKEAQREMSSAHAHGFHNPIDGLPREGCPDCRDAGWLQR
jgi:hypothetical protein